jgi:hypothetical protein
MNQFRVQLRGKPHPDLWTALAKNRVWSVAAKYRTNGRTTISANERLSLGRFQGGEGHCGAEQAECLRRSELQQAAPSVCAGPRYAFRRIDQTSADTLVMRAAAASIIGASMTIISSLLRDSHNLYGTLQERTKEDHLWNPAIFRITRTLASNDGIQEDRRSGRESFPHPDLRARPRPKPASNGLRPHCRFANGSLPNAALRYDPSKNGRVEGALELASDGHPPGPYDNGLQTFEARKL